MSGLELSEFLMYGAPRRAFEQHDRWHLGPGAHPLRPRYDRRASASRNYRPLRPANNNDYA